MPLDPTTFVALQQKLDKLKKTHKNMEYKIIELMACSPPNDLEIYRIKREKLALKDQITKIDGLLVPDIIA